jgi:hypothetical protein
MHFTFTGILLPSVEEGLGSMMLAVSHCQCSSTIAKLQREKKERKVGLTSDWQQIQYAVKDNILVFGLCMDCGLWIVVVWDVWDVLR